MNLLNKIKKIIYRNMSAAMTFVAGLGVIIGAITEYLTNIVEAIAK